MIDTKFVEYKKAYVELLGILEMLPKDALNKIPNEVINNIEKMKDFNYSWSYDVSKDIVDQDLMVETKALFVQLYRNYFMEEKEKEKWDKYDNIIQKVIEEEKIKLYDPAKIFENKNVELHSDDSNINKNIEESLNEVESQEKSLILAENNIFQKISKIFKDFISRFFKK